MDRRCIVTCVTSLLPGESLRSHEHEARPPDATPPTPGRRRRPVAADRPAGFDRVDRAGAPPSQVAVRAGVRHPDGFHARGPCGSGSVRATLVRRRAVCGAADAVELAARDGKRPRSGRAHVARTEILTIFRFTEETG